MGEILVDYVHICGLTGLCYQIVNQLSNIVLRIKKIITINILHVRFSRKASLRKIISIAKLYRNPISPNSVYNSLAKLCPYIKLFEHSNRFPHTGSQKKGGFVGFSFYRVTKRIPSCTDRLVPPYTQADMPRWRKAIAWGGKSSSTFRAINVLIV